MNWDKITAELDRTHPKVLRNLRAPACVVPALDAPARDGLVAIDITMDAGRITAITAAEPERRDGIDMGGRIVWPLAVDCHTHLDKGQVWSRSPNLDGSFTGAQKAAHADHQTYRAADDIRARAEFALRAAYAHGTGLLRSHVDANPQTFPTRFGVLRELAQDWAGRVAVQLCPFTGDMADTPWLQQRAEAAGGPQGGALSFFVQPAPKLDADLERVMRLATAHDLALDFHADETLDPASNTLAQIARAARATGFERRILVGHCCALSVQDADTVARTLDLVAQTQIAIVALPLCNMYLQDRDPQNAPRQRGIAPLREIAARGIPVAIASDNTRDSFYAYGDLDVPELFRDALRMMQLDHPVADWPATVTATAADVIGAPRHGRLTAGQTADMIVFSARNWSEFTARPASDRIVLRAGLPCPTTPPDYAELDHLTDMDP